MLLPENKVQEVLSLELVVVVHGEMVVQEVLVVVSQVFIIMEFSSLVLAVEAVAVDQVVDSTVVEPLMVAIKVMTCRTCTVTNFYK